MEFQRGSRLHEQEKQLVRKAGFVNVNGASENQRLQAESHFAKTTRGYRDPLASGRDRPQPQSANVAVFTFQCTKCSILELKDGSLINA